MFSFLPLILFSLPPSLPLPLSLSPSCPLSLPASLSLPLPPSFPLSPPSPSPSLSLPLSFPLSLPLPLSPSLSLSLSLFSLLVLGMDHYGSSSWKLIQEKLLPTKTTKQVSLVTVMPLVCYYGNYNKVVSYFCSFIYVLRI